MQLVFPKFALASWSASSLSNLYSPVTYKNSIKQYLKKIKKALYKWIQNLNWGLLLLGSAQHLKPVTNKGLKAAMPYQRAGAKTWFHEE